MEFPFGTIPEQIATCHRFETELTGVKTKLIDNNAGVPAQLNTLIDDIQAYCGWLGENESAIAPYFTPKTMTGGGTT